MDNIILNKSKTIERCILRIKEEYVADFDTNFSHQDAAILNIERACQACIDMASHWIRIKKLGVPNSSREVFSLLEEKKIISEKLSTELQKMVGFRNIAVHDYSSMNITIVKKIIEGKLTNLSAFSQIMIKTQASNE